MTELLTLHLFADDYPPPLFWQLARWCQKRRVDEWNVTAVETKKGKKSGTDILDQFDVQTAPFRLADARRRHLTSRGASGLHFVRPLELWQSTAKSLTVLEEFFPDGVFRCYPPNCWLEDPMFYRDGELMLGVVSHEKEGILRVTAQEQQQLEHDGFPFRRHGVYVGY